MIIFYSSSTIPVNLNSVTLPMRSCMFTTQQFFVFLTFVMRKNN